MCGDLTEAPVLVSTPESRGISIGYGKAYGSRPAARIWFVVVVHGQVVEQFAYIISIVSGIL